MCTCKFSCYWLHNDKSRCTLQNFSLKNIRRLSCISCTVLFIYHRLINKTPIININWTFETKTITNQEFTIRNPLFISAKKSFKKEECKKEHVNGLCIYTFQGVLFCLFLLLCMATCRFMYLGFLEPVIIPMPT